MGRRRGDGASNRRPPKRFGGRSSPAAAVQGRSWTCFAFACDLPPLPRLHSGAGAWGPRRKEAPCPGSLRCVAARDACLSPRGARHPVSVSAGHRDLVMLCSGVCSLANERRRHAPRASVEWRARRPTYSLAEGHGTPAPPVAGGRAQIPAQRRRRGGRAWVQARDLSRRRDSGRTRDKRAGP